MLSNLTLEKLRNLKFFGMAKAFEEQMNSPEFESLCFEERFGLLVDREVTNRAGKPETSDSFKAGQASTASLYGRYRLPTSKRVGQIRAPVPFHMPMDYRA
jgi:hypothetical protein